MEASPCTPNASSCTPKLDLMPSLPYTVKVRSNFSLSYYLMQ